MATLWNWTTTESTQSTPRYRLYDCEFKTELNKLIPKLKNKSLQKQLSKMFDCPIRDRQGNFQEISEYIERKLDRSRIDRDLAVYQVFEELKKELGQLASKPKTKSANNPLHFALVVETRKVIQRITADMKPNYYREIGEALDDIQMLLKNHKDSGRLPLNHMMRFMILSRTLNQLKKKYGKESAMESWKIVNQTLQDYSDAVGDGCITDLMKRISK